jgi:hypothetical protein
MDSLRVTMSVHTRVFMGEMFVRRCLRRRGCFRGLLPSGLHELGIDRWRLQRSSLACALGRDLRGRRRGSHIILRQHRIRR